MNKAINTGIGVTGVAIQLLVLNPWHNTISNDIRKLEKRLDENNQILKEERQERKKEFKDL